MADNPKLWRPRYAPNGAISMRTGLLSNVDGSGVYITPSARRALKVDLGDYVEIRNDERGTVVNRAVREAHTDAKVRDDYAYVDKTSFALLAANLHDEITVLASTLQMDAP